MKKTYLLLFVIALSAHFCFAYELILKNGKTIQGTFVSEDAEKITIKDQAGVTMNFKKALIDLEKTAHANLPEEPAKPAVEEKKAPEKSADEKPEKPKKPAKVYTANDLYRLRGEYPMDNSGADIQSPSPNLDEPKGMTGEQWQELTQDLLNQIKQAEQYSQEATAKCKELQGATIQTHVVVNEQHQAVDMAEATKAACQAAEDAKAQVEAARQEYENAVEQARQQNVLPGYITHE